MIGLSKPRSGPVRTPKGGAPSPCPLPRGERAGCIPGFFQGYSFASFATSCRPWIDLGQDRVEIAASSLQRASDSRRRPRTHILFPLPLRERAIIRACCSRRMMGEGCLARHGWLGYSGQAWEYTLMTRPGKKKTKEDFQNPVKGRGAANRCGRSGNRGGSPLPCRSRCG